MPCEGLLQSLADATARCQNLLDRVPAYEGDDPEVAYLAEQVRGTAEGEELPRRVLRIREVAFGFSDGRVASVLRDLASRLAVAGRSEATWLLA